MQKYQRQTIGNCNPGTENNYLKKCTFRKPVLQSEGTALFLQRSLPKKFSLPWCYGL